MRFRRFHCALIVRDDDELRIVAELPDDARETVDIGIVERRIHFVQDTERGRLHEIDGEQQCDRRQRLLSSGKQVDGGGRLPRGFAVISMRASSGSAPSSS